MLELVLAIALLALVVATVPLIVTATHIDRLARQGAAQLQLSIDIGKRLLVLLDHAPTDETRGEVQRPRASGVVTARSAIATTARNVA